MHKVLANLARERTAVVLAMLHNAVVAEPRGAGRPDSQQLWEDGLRGFVTQVEAGAAEKPREYVATENPHQPTCSTRSGSSSHCHPFSPLYRLNIGWRGASSPRP